MVMKTRNRSEIEGVYHLTTESLLVTVYSDVSHTPLLIPRAARTAPNGENSVEGAPRIAKHAP
jgi:hypothetical protein